MRSLHHCMPWIIKFPSLIDNLIIEELSAEIHDRPRRLHASIFLFLACDQENALSYVESSSPDCIIYLRFCYNLHCVIALHRLTSYENAAQISLGGISNSAAYNISHQSDPESNPFPESNPLPKSDPESKLLSVSKGSGMPNDSVSGSSFSNGFPWSQAFRPIRISWSR